MSQRSALVRCWYIVKPAFFYAVFFVSTLSVFIFLPNSLVAKKIQEATGIIPPGSQKPAPKQVEEQGAKSFYIETVELLRERKHDEYFMRYKDPLDCFYSKDNVSVAEYRHKRGKKTDLDHETVGVHYFDKDKALIHDLAYVGNACFGRLSLMAKNAENQWEILSESGPEAPGCLRPYYVVLQDELKKLQRLRISRRTHNVQVDSLKSNDWFVVIARPSNVDRALCLKDSVLDKLPVHVVGPTKNNKYAVLMGPYTHQTAQNAREYLRSWLALINTPNEEGPFALRWGMFQRQNCENSQCEIIHGL